MVTCPPLAVPSKTREVRHFLENVGHEEEQTQRRANHWLPETGRGGHPVRLIGDGPRLFSAILFSLRPDALNMRT